MYCKHCGAKIEEGSTYCTNCGGYVAETNIKEIDNEDKPIAKSKVVAGVFAIVFLGLGIHNFYLGYVGKGIAQLLLTVIGWIVIVGPLISVIWSLVEGIIYLVSNDKVDARGIPLE